MAKTIRKKEYITSNVYEAALERIRYIYQSFDKVVVSFSGGKDSTAVLNTALVVAKELGRLPLDVVFFDEEAIHPPTIEYVERVKQHPDINLGWYCLEFKHRNACSNEEPFWYTWDKDKKPLWVRDMPEHAITSHHAFRKGMTFQEFCPFIYPKNLGKIAMLTGIRTQESLRRYQVIALKKNDAFLNSRSEKGSNQYRGFPIYDWSSEDVWLAVHEFGWDYNKTYDLFNQTSMHNNFLRQRVCPPFGEEPIRGLYVYAECFPEMWHKMLDRVQGVATAWRYANSELYSNSSDKPFNLTWQEYVDVILDSYEHDSKEAVKQSIQGYINRHKTKTKQKISDEEVHPISGVSWQFLCKVAIRGDFKTRQSNTLNVAADNARKKLGITLKEAIKLYS
jgi:predicted phosphoadenosine phosphosulfate sulfurtransferase